MNISKVSENNLLTKIQSYLYTIVKSINKNNTFLIISLILLFIGLSVFYYYYYVVQKKKLAYTANTEYGGEDSSTNKKAELILFYVDWCPHCKTAKPVWDDLSKEYQNKTINGYNIIFTEINCTNETSEVESIVNKYNIESFPTIKLLKDNQIIEYDAKPTKETLTQFLNTVL